MNTDSGPGELVCKTVRFVDHDGEVRTMEVAVGTSVQLEGGTLDVGVIDENQLYRGATFEIPLGPLDADAVRMLWGLPPFMDPALDC